MNADLIVDVDFPHQRKNHAVHFSKTVQLHIFNRPNVARHERPHETCRQGRCLFSSRRKDFERTFDDDASSSSLRSIRQQIVPTPLLVCSQYFLEWVWWCFLVLLRYICFGHLSFTHWLGCSQNRVQWRSGCHCIHCSQPRSSTVWWSTAEMTLMRSQPQTDGAQCLTNCHTYRSMHSIN